MSAFRPSKADLLAAVDKTVPDVIAPGLKVLFCGINPGLYSAAVGHHFARPGNRFWPALFLAGITPRLLAPHEERELLALGFGITNVVERASARADELSRAELTAGGKVLAAKVERYAPRILAVLGVSAYRAAFQRPAAQMGPQPETTGGAITWIIPNPIGLNAHYTLDALADLLRELKTAASQEAA